MRQLLLIGVLFCSFLLVVRFLPLQFTSYGGAEAFVPEEAWFFSTHRNARKRLAHFRQGHLGQSLKKVDLEQLLGLFIGAGHNGEQPFQACRKLSELLEDRNLQDLIGSNFSLALLPFASRFGEDGINDASRTSVVLITKPRRHTRTLEALSCWFADSLTVSESRYGRYTIRRFSSDGTVVVVSCRTDGFLVLTRDERLLRHCLDVHDGDHPSLYRNRIFRSEREKRARAASFSFVDLEKLQKNWARESAQGAGPGSSPDSRFFELITFSGYRQLFWHWWEEGRQFRQLLRLDSKLEQAPDQHRQPLSSQPPSRTATAGLVSSDTICFYWTNNFRPEILVELIKRQGFPNLLEDAGRSARIAPERIPALLGNEFFLAAKGLPGHQFVPIPPLLLGVKLSDPDGWKQFIDKIVRQYKIPVMETVFQETNVVSWGEVYNGIDLQPTFAVAGDYFLIASNRRQIREFISLSRKRQGLSATDVYQNLDLDLSGKNNSIAVLRPAKVASLAQEIISWTGTMLAIQDRETARKSKVIIDRVLIPLLDAFRVYNAMGVRSYFENDKLFIEAVTSFEDQKR